MGLDAKRTEKAVTEVRKHRKQALQALWKAHPDGMLSRTAAEEAALDRNYRKDVAEGNDKNRKFGAGSDATTARNPAASAVDFGLSERLSPAEMQMLLQVSVEEKSAEEALRDKEARLSAYKKQEEQRLEEASEGATTAAEMRTEVDALRG